MFNFVKCSCCGKDFSYMTNSLPSKRENTILNSYEFPKEIMREIHITLSCICINCFKKYKAQPEILMFEIQLGLLK